jgi:Tfp pilus assembly protein FimT
MMELVMVVVVVAIITSWVLPDSNTEATQQGESAGKRLESDISFARSLSIARPDDPVVIKFDPPDDSYWLARSSAENTPILHPVTGKPYKVMYGAKSNCGLTRVSITGVDLGGDAILKFKGTGVLDQSTAAVVQMSAGGSTCEVVVSPKSGDCAVSSILTKTLAPVTKIAEDLLDLGELGL